MLLKSGELSHFNPFQSISSLQRSRSDAVVLGAKVREEELPAAVQEVLRRPDLAADSELISGKLLREKVVKK